MKHSFAINLNRSQRFNSRQLSERNTRVLERQPETFETGVAITEQFDKYVNPDVATQFDLEMNLRQIRDKKKLFKSEYQKIINRLQYQRKKDERLVNTSLSQQQREEKEEQFKMMQEMSERKRIQSQLKFQKVGQLKKKLQRGRNMGFFISQQRKKKQVAQFRRRFSSQKNEFQRLRQLSIQQIQSKHDSILKMKQGHMLKKEIMEMKRNQRQKSQVMQRIWSLREETSKTMGMIDQLRSKQSKLQKRNKTCGKILINILESYKKLQNL